MSRFPNRSRVIYSEQQKQAQKRFSDAVSFARVVIKEPGLKDIYSIKAVLLGFRSAWNLAIAEFMSETPLVIKKKKIRFDKSILRRSLRWNIPVKLYMFAEESEHCVLKVPPRVLSKPRRERKQAARGLPDFGRTGRMVIACNVSVQETLLKTVPDYNFKYFTLLHDNCQH